jgi:hypothetical protein
MSSGVESRFERYADVMVEALIWRSWCGLRVERDSISW